MTYTTVVAAMLDGAMLNAAVFGSDELPGWSHPAAVNSLAGLSLDFFASDDLPGWSHPSFTVAA